MPRVRSSPAPTISATTRRVVLVAGSILTVLALVGSGLNLLTKLAHDRRLEQVTFDSEQLRAVSIGNTAGGVELRGTSDGTVVVDTRIDDGLFRARIDTRVRDDVLEVRSSCPWGFATRCGVHQSVAAPPDRPASVRGRHGDVRIDSMRGPLTVDSRFGDLHLGGVEGPVSIEHGFGSVDGVDLGSSSVVVDHRYGDVRLAFTTVPEEVRVTGRYGSTVIEVPDDGTAYRITGSSSMGSRRIDVRTDPDAGPQIHVDHRFGDVTIRYAR